MNYRQRFSLSICVSCSPFHSRPVPVSFIPLFPLSRSASSSPLCTFSFYYVCIDIFVFLTYHLTNSNPPLNAGNALVVNLILFFHTSRSLSGLNVQLSSIPAFPAARLALSLARPLPLRRRRHEQARTPTSILSYFHQPPKSNVLSFPFRVRRRSRSESEKTMCEQKTRKKKKDYVKRGDSAWSAGEEEWKNEQTMK